MVSTLKISCISGPWLDSECVRFIDIPENASLYDLHVAIQDAVMFDDEFPFFFFQALAPEGKRTMIPDGMYADEDEDNINTDVYEDIHVSNWISEKAKKSLFYVFLSESEEWMFKITHTGKTHKEVKGEFYPLVLESMSIGPSPEQYGSGFDDYSEDDEDFRPNKARLTDDYNRDDEFFDDDEEDEYDSMGRFDDGEFDDEEGPF